MGCFSVIFAELCIAVVLSAWWRHFTARQKSHGVVVSCRKIRVLLEKSMLLSKHARIGLGWTFCTIFGIGTFYLSKKSIDQKRYDNMKVRERMRQANIGEYEPSYRKFAN